MHLGCATFLGLRDKGFCELDSLEIKGFAWSGGGKGIVRVDVSLDGGRTWVRGAQLPNRSSRPGSALETRVRHALAPLWRFRRPPASSSHRCQKREIHLRFGG